MNLMKAKPAGVQFKFNLSKSDRKTLGRVADLVGVPPSIFLRMVIRQWGLATGPAIREMGCKLVDALAGVRG